MFKLKLNVNEMADLGPGESLPHERGIIEEPPPNKISLVFIV